MKSSGRYLFIDALRGFAALAVVLFHAYEGHHIDALFPLLPAPLALLFSHGDLGVQIFFVLSGFVIAHSLARQDVGAEYLGRFLLRRSIRLDPPYWASMVLVVAVSLLSVRFVPGKVYEPPGLVEVVSHVLYLPVLLGQPLINAIYWTLCLEIQFYLVFALLMAAVTHLRPRLGERQAFLGMLIGACVVSLPWSLGKPPFSVPGLFLDQWHFFLAGAVAWRTSFYRDERASLWLAVLYIGWLFALALWLGDPARGVAAVTAGSIVLVGRLGKLTEWLSAAPLQHLGAISYSLYLTHNPLTGAFFRAGYKLTGRSLAFEVVWLVLVVGLCVFGAWLFHLLIERPSLKLSHRVSMRTRPVLHPEPARVL